MGKTEQYCTFELHDLLLGIPVPQVQEVLRCQELTPVPLAPDSVAGLMNLRGHIVVAIDLRRRLGLPARSAGQRPMNIVIHTEDGPVSLLVDEIHDMLELELDAVEKPPQTMRNSGCDLIAGTYKLPSRLLLLLDPAQVVDLHCDHIRSDAVAPAESLSEQSLGGRGFCQAEPDYLHPGLCPKNADRSAEMQTAESSNNHR